jgi:glycosyltransferase involved in cell wall biosynthesis
MLSSVALAAGAFILGFWLLHLWMLVRTARAIPTVAGLTAPPLERWPLLTMVVPARDEGHGIEAALGSKLACGYPALEIVAVNDRSNDDTGAIIDRLAAKDTRITAVHVTELPEGWLGKLNAMAKGVERAKGEWVLLSDADVHVEPGTLQKLIAHAEGSRLDFIAVFPRMDPVGPLIDAVVIIFLRVLSLTGRLWQANDDRSHIGIGVGAFNLVRRSALEATRAFSHLRMEAADDVALGALIKNSGCRARFYAGRGDVHLVFMRHFSDLTRSIRKGGHMFGFSLWVPLVFAFGLPLVELAPFAVAFGAGGAAATLAALAYGVAVVSHVLISRHFDGAWWSALWWPVGLVVIMWLMAWSGLVAWRRQGVEWRGTFYSRAQLEAGRRISPVDMRIELPK